MCNSSEENPDQYIIDAEEDSDFVDGALLLAFEVFARDGWDNPEMDIYNELDPRNET